MNWEERIKAYEKKKAKYNKARAKFDEVKSEWSEEQDALLDDLTQHKEAVGEDPTCVVNGRMIGKTFAVTKGCTDPVKLAELLVKLDATEFLKPNVGQVHDALEAGQFDEAEAKRVKRLLTTSSHAKLFDRKAPGKGK